MSMSGVLVPFQAPPKKIESYRYHNLKTLESLSWKLDSSGFHVGTQVTQGTHRAHSAQSGQNIQNEKVDTIQTYQISGRDFNKQPPSFLQFMNELTALNTRDDHDLFAHLNDEYWTQGLFVQVPEGFESTEPVVVELNATQGFAASRLWISVGKGANVTVALRFQGEGAGLQTPVVQVILNENASLEWARINLADAGARLIAKTQMFLKAGASLNAFQFSAGAALIRENFSVTFAGTLASAKLYGLTVAGGESVVDDHTEVFHRVGGCVSDQLYKSVLGGKAKYIFNGRIVIDLNAQKALSSQLNQNLLLTDGAEVNTKPQLEISADDVKATHGCTIGQLNQEEVFYFMSRGISRDNSEKMLRQGFGHELVFQIQNEKLRDLLWPYLAAADARLS